MILLQQGGRHIAAALMQLLLDWLVFVAATAAGLPPVPGNPLGRSSGALLGFWLNSRYTFRVRTGAATAARPRALLRTVATDDDGQ